MNKSIIYMIFANMRDRILLGFVWLLGLAVVGPSAFAQTYLSDLEWSPDSTSIILPIDQTGEPAWLPISTLLSRAGITDDQTITQFEIVGTTLQITIEDGNTMSIDISDLLDYQDLSIQDSVLVLSDGDNITLGTGTTGGDKNEIRIIDASGNERRYHFKEPTVPLVDEQQLSLTGNTLTLTNGGTVDLSSIEASGGVDTVYAAGNELRVVIDAVEYAITIESCVFCDPLTIRPFNSATVTETQDLDAVTTLTSLGATTVVASNTSDCSTLDGHMYARAKLEIYGHQMAEYIAYIEYQVDGGSWTKINESEREIYRNAGNYEEDVDLFGLVPITIDADDSASYSIRAKVEVADTGFGSLFIIGDADEGTARWRSTDIRLDFLLSNTTD